MVCLNVSITEKKMLLALSPNDHSLYFQSKTAVLNLLLLGLIKVRAGPILSKLHI